MFNRKKPCGEVFKPNSSIKNEWMVHRKLIMRTSLVMFFLVVFSIQVNYSDHLKFDHTDIFNNHKLPKMIIEIETGSIVKANIKATEFYSMSEDNLLEKTIYDLSELSNYQLERNLNDAFIEKNDYFTSTHILNNGETRTVDIYTYPISNTHGKFLYSIILDKTESTRLANKIENDRKLLLVFIFLVLVIFIIFLILLFKEKEKYRKLSHYDFLTGAYSRTFLDTWIDDLKNNDPLKQKKKFIVMIDINKFKFINDFYGHLVGDQVLKFVAKTLEKHTRANDLVIRFGGDEFVLIIEESKESVVYLVLDRIKSELRKNNKFNFSIEISYGVEHISDYDDLFQSINRADQEMYNMKENLDEIDE